MKIIQIIASVLFVVLFTATGYSQGTTFTYQGVLNQNGAPYSGTAELQPTLWNAVTNGTQVAANSPSQILVSVTNGLFVIPLDFGANFPGTNRWLQLEVRTTIGPFTTLTPRQALTPVPYAMTASNVSGSISASQLSGTISSGNLSGTYASALTLNNAANNFSGNGSGLTALNASALASGTVPDARISASIARANQVWLLNGNGGTSPGTDFIGTTDNQPLVVKVNGLRAFGIIDPGDSTHDGNTLSDGAPNIVAGAPVNYIAPGMVGSTIAGGGATNYGGAVYSNSIFADFSTILGGVGHVIASNATHSTIGGGYQNSIDTNSSHSSVLGGYWNSIGANSSSCIILGGYSLSIGTNSYNSFMGNGYLNGINDETTLSVLVGGMYNGIGSDSSYSFMGGGYNNRVHDSTEFTAIVGGNANQVFSSSKSSIIAGGATNQIYDNSVAATIVGGFQGYVGTNCDYALIGGGIDNEIHENSRFATIAGGKSNRIFEAPGALVSGGESNEVGEQSTNSVIVGGNNNTIQSDAGHSAILGGRNHSIEIGSTYALVGSGDDNDILTDSPYATIGGGSNNTIQANSPNATIPGGRSNIATNYSFAAGYSARAVNSGSFVWSDGNGTVTTSTNNNSVTFRSTGGFRILTATGNTGTQVLPGGTSWSVVSDRNLKKDVQPVDAQAVLDKLAKVPVSEWHYEWESESEPKNIGPMAQDFKAAFFPGRDEKSISTLEFDGVAIAAIQGLNQKLEEQNADLKKRLLELEAIVAKLAADRIPR